MVERQHGSGSWVASVEMGVVDGLLESTPGGEFCWVDWWGQTDEWQQAGEMEGFGGDT